MSIVGRISEDEIQDRWQRQSADSQFATLVRHVQRRAALGPGEELNFDMVRGYQLEIDPAVELRAAYFRGSKLVASHGIEVRVGWRHSLSESSIVDRVCDALGYLANVVRPHPGPKQRIQRWRGKMRP